MAREKNVVDRLATIRSHSLRREILQTAEEAHHMGALVSPIGLHKKLKAPLGSVSYHVKVLVENSALELVKMEPRRGANEHFYGLNVGFLAEITDAVALDRIAELMDEWGLKGPYDVEALCRVVRATGRPVKA